MHSFQISPLQRKNKQRGKSANSTFPAIQDSVMQWEVCAHPMSGCPLQAVIKLHTQVREDHSVRPQFSALPHILNKIPCQQEHLGCRELNFE